MTPLANITIIDGVQYQIGLLTLRRMSRFMDKDSTGRTADGGLHRELIGVFFNYQATYGQNLSISDYNAFYLDITQPLPFRTVELRFGSTVIIPAFDAYFGDIDDELEFVDKNGVTWKGLSLSFIAKIPARIPA